MSVDLRAPETLVSDLRHATRGNVTGPNDDGYDAARSVMYGDIDGRPAAIVRVQDAADVSRVILFVRDRDLDLAVRSGGHGSAGYAVADGAIVIDVRDLRSIEL